MTIALERRPKTTERGETPLGRTKIALDWMGDEEALLDIGCSDGTFISFARPRCGRAVGIDIDDEMLAKARQRSPNAEFFHGSADDLPFDDDEFSIITMMDVLEHVPKPDVSLSEVDRVLRPGGRLILSVPNKGTFGFLDAQNSIVFAAGRRILIGKKDEVMEHRHFRLPEVASIVGPKYVVQRLHMGGYLVFPLCGYIIMFTDGMNLRRVSTALRKVEERDFQRNYGQNSWHMMVEFVKTGGMA